MADGVPPSGSPALDVAQLVALHHESLYRYAYRLTGSVPDAEDLTQQVFLTAQTKLSQVRDAQCVRSWLFAVLRNSYLRSFRKRVPIPVANLELNIDSIPEEAVVDEGLDRERLQIALNELPDDFKMVLLLFYFEECSYLQIAERLELPIGTVMSRLSRAKSHLRLKLYEPEYHGAAE